MVKSSLIQKVIWNEGDKNKQIGNWGKGVHFGTYGVKVAHGHSVGGGI